MRRSTGLVLALAVVGGCARSVRVGSDVPARGMADAGVARAAATITARDMHDRIAFLSSDAMRGRDTPSPGLEMAARYIADQFRSFGLQPAGDGGTYLQRWPYVQREVDLDRSVFSFESPHGNLTAVWGRDYFIAPGPDATTTGPLYFAGAASAKPSPLPEEAKGKVLAFYMPGADPGDAWQQMVGATVLNAIGVQPAAVILILDPALPQEALAAFAGPMLQNGPPITVAGVSFAKMGPFLGEAGLSSEEITAPASAQVQLRRVPEVNARIQMAFTGDTAHPPNVVAILPGSDPRLKDQYVVFSGHMDHLGVGEPDARGDSIYNGADDDASGSSAVLEVAQAFSSLPRHPARSLIFLTVSGEEKGLYGSAYFNEHPPVPAAQIVADINVDMVSRNAPDSVVAIGQAYSSLGPLIQQVARAHPELGLTVSDDLWPEERLFFRSDHFNFARNGIAAIFLFAGLHEDYHQPSDEVDKIDADKAARIARLVFHLGYAVASDPQPPAWTALGRREVAAMKQ